MKMYILPILVLLLILIAPDTVSAQGLVPNCSGNSCGTCDLVAMANSIVSWLITMLAVVFAALMVVAGFGLVTSGGNQSALDAAKSKFTNGIVGFIIVLAAFLIVDTFMSALLRSSGGSTSGFGPWSQVTCSTQAASQQWAGDPQAPDGTLTTPPVNGTMPSSCTGGQNGTCVALGIPCANQNSCTISPDLAARLQAFHQAAAVDGARVTEAMPPTRTHRSACHNNGTCIDYGKPGGMSSAEVIRTINAARANGLRPVYEVHTQAHKDSLVAAGAPPSSVMVLGNWISAPHFSIYGY